MRKSIDIFLVVLWLFSAVGCGSFQGVSTPVGTAESQTSGATLSASGAVEEMPATVIPEAGNPTLQENELFLTPQPTPEQPVLAGRIPVLEYHDTEFNMAKTVQMRTEWFLEQMGWLAENDFRTLSGEELISFVAGGQRPPQKSVVLRFDIGLPALENYREVVIPTLEKYGFHAIFFVLIHAVRDTCEKDYLCWDQLKEWEDVGIIEVGSHGVYHPDYKDLKPKERKQDALESKEIIESHLGHPIHFFAFPYDSVPGKPEALLASLGYRLAFAGYRAERSVLWQDPDPFSLPSYYVYSGEKTYPVITGTGGLTFGEMMMEAVEKLEP